METGPDGTVRQRAPDLETFLGGMETEGEKNISLFLLHALKPSLVEWKQVFGEVFEAMAKALKPSLVEWKPTKSRRSPPLHQALETFLGGMET